MKTNNKRIIAILLDFFSFILAWILIANVYTLLFINNNESYKSNNDIMSSCLLDTKLYEIKNGNVVQIEEKINENFILYYKNKENKYLDTYDKYSSYEESKMQSGLFELSSSNLYYVEKENVDKEDLTYFYSKEFKKLEVSLYNTNANYKQALDYNNKITAIGSYTSIVISSLIIYFVIPLILKKGQTLFYKLLKLTIISEDDKDCSFAQVFIHAWANTFIILLALKFYFISFAVEILVYFIDKKHRTIGDFVSVSKCEELFEYEKKRR